MVACALMRNGDWEQYAVQHPNDEIRKRLDRFDSYLAQDPENAALVADAFDLALATGLLDRAAKYVDMATAQWPDDPYFLNRQALLHAANKNWLLAESQLSDLCERYPQEPGLAVSLASVLFHTGQFERARAILEPLSTADALPIDGVAVLLRSLHHLHDLEAAGEVIERHRSALSQNADAAGSAALILLDRGDFSGAAHWSATALSLDTASAEGLVVAGVVALGRQDVDRAETLLNEALRLRPEEGRVWSGLGMASMLRVDIPTALQRLGKATELWPTHVGTWHALGWAHIAARDLPAAERVFRHALELDRNFGESHGGLAVVLAMQGRNAEAEVAAELGLRLDPGSMSARYASAILRGEVGDNEAFAKLAGRLLRNVDAPGGGNLADWVARRGGPLG